MKILITGGAGFLGSNLCRYFLTDGHHVTVVDNFVTGSQSNMEIFRPDPRYRFHELSVDHDSFINEFSNLEQYQFDRVYHLACPTGVPNIETLGEEMMDTSSIGTKNVLKIALLHQAKLLFTSSCEIYGDPLVNPQSEAYTGNVDPQGPRANYEEAKRFSETLVALYVHKYGLAAMTVRLFNAYGSGMNLSDTRVIPRFISQALTSKPLTLHGSGEQLRTLCYVDDLVQGLVVALEQGEAGGIYNLGSADAWTMANLAKAIIKETNSDSKIVEVDRPEHDHQFRAPDLRRIYRLGWHPTTPLNVGLKITATDIAERLGLTFHKKALPLWSFGTVR